MAQPLICKIDDVERADWLIGNLESGDQVAVCNTCLVGWCLAQLDAMLSPEAKGQVAAVFAAAAQPPDPEETSAGDAPKSGPGRPGRRRAGRADPEQARADQEASLAARAAQEAAQTPAPGEDPAAADAS